MQSHRTWFFVAAFYNKNRQRVIELAISDIPLYKKMHKVATAKLK